MINHLYRCSKCGQTRILQLLEEIPTASEVACPNCFGVMWLESNDAPNPQPPATGDLLLDWHKSANYPPKIAPT